MTAIIGELVGHWEATPKTGPGNKGKRERLEQIFTDLSKRTTMMNYNELLAEKLEISTGQIEGAVKYVLGLRCDPVVPRGPPRPPRRRRPTRPRPPA